jgi:hypothetical protein
MSGSRRRRVYVRSHVLGSTVSAVAELLLTMGHCDNAATRRDVRLLADLGVCWAWMGGSVDSKSTAALLLEYRIAAGPGEQLERR